MVINKLTCYQKWAPLHFKGAALPLPFQLQKWSGVSAPAPIFKKEWRSRSRSTQKGAPLFLPLLYMFKTFIKKQMLFFFALGAAN